MITVITNIFQEPTPPGNMRMHWIPTIVNTHPSCLHLSFYFWAGFWRQWYSAVEFSLAVGPSFMGQLCKKISVIKIRTLKLLVNNYWENFILQNLARTCQNWSISSLHWFIFLLFDLFLYHWSIFWIYLLIAHTSLFFYCRLNHEVYNYKDFKYCDTICILSENTYDVGRMRRYCRNILQWNKNYTKSTKMTQWRIPSSVQLRLCLFSRVWEWEDHQSNCLEWWMMWPKWWKSV